METAQETTTAFDVNGAPARVRQTDFSPGSGNALQACVAAVLRLGLDEVPNFVVAPEGYTAAIDAFLRTPVPPRPSLTLRRRPLPWGGDDSAASADVGRVCILRGVSPRGDFGHVVVARLAGAAPTATFELLWDPHPDDTFLDATKPFGWAAFFDRVALA